MQKRHLNVCMCVCESAKERRKQHSVAKQRNQSKPITTEASDNYATIHLFIGVSAVLSRSLCLVASLSIDRSITQQAMYQLDELQVKKASVALLKHIAAEKARAALETGGKKELFEDAEWLSITFALIKSPTPSPKAHRMYVDTSVTMASPNTTRMTTNTTISLVSSIEFESSSRVCVFVLTRCRSR